MRQHTSTAPNGGRGTYDDRMAMVWRRPDGTYVAQTFTGNTDPARGYEARGYGREVNGDGRKELGRLVEGNYRYELQSGDFAGNRYFRATETQVAGGTATMTASSPLPTGSTARARAGRCRSIGVGPAGPDRRAAGRCGPAITTRCSPALVAGPASATCW